MTNLTPTAASLEDAHVAAPVAGRICHQEHPILNHHIRVEEASGEHSPPAGKPTRSDFGIPGGKPRRERPRTAFRVFLPILSALLFAAAFWILYRELQSLHLRDIARYFRELSHNRIALAVLSSLLSYLMLVGYDIVGLRYVGHPLPYRQTAFASYIAYGLSNSIGFSFASGGFVRYRLYSAWGLSGAEIARLVLFSIFSSFLGFFSVAGICFVAKPEKIPSSVPLPASSIRPIGALFLLLVTAYVCLVLLSRGPLRIGGRPLTLPPGRLLPWQLLVSTLD